MARTIRFRAWDKQDAKMLIWGVHTGYIKDAMPDDMGDEWIERCELMQFTGLIDVAGIRIYESDIIRDRTGNHYEVKYDDGQWWAPLGLDTSYILSLIHISEPTRQAEISYAV